MSEKYKFRDRYLPYFSTTTVVDWIDVFTRRDYAEIVINSLRHCRQEKGLNLHAWCLMPSHLHMIVSIKEGFTLSDFFRDFKKFTSKAIVNAVEEIPESRREWMLERFYKAGAGLKRIKDYKFWQDGNHPEPLYTSSIMQQKLDYIHMNPVKAGLVFEPEQYVYSSAINYAEKTGGLLDVDFPY